MAAYRRVYDSWLTAKNRDQFQNPTLGNLVWATFLSVSGMGQTRRTDGWTEREQLRYSFTGGLINILPT